ncbi:MAG: hypothetical protein IPQ09_19215 [Myxococcales bacterium]|jgi:hypothetical protein|nr:hypothetical protein [Myxococcales bacterium]
MIVRPAPAASSLSFALALPLALALLGGCTVETLVPGSGEPRQAPASETGAPPEPSEPGASPAPPVSSGDAGAGEGAAPPAAEPAEVSLRATGDCAPDFRDLVVATNTSSFDSIAVSNGASPTSGSFQLALSSGRRSFTLSTRDRTEQRDVMNLMAGGVVYTNLCNATTCAYDAATKSWRNDPIEGTVSVSAYEPRKGALEVKLSGVVLQAAQGRGLCRLDGTVKARRLGR